MFQFLCWQEFAAKLPYTPPASVDSAVKMGALFVARFATALFALAGLAHSTEHGSNSEGPIVKTSSGSVRGYYPHSTVRAFLGIPYAEPPIGTLRFKPPVPYKPKEDKTLEATRFGFSCIQVHTETPALGFPTTGENEDCLTLNIWSAVAPAADLKPVFVWLPGGGFTEGSTSVNRM